MIDGKLAVAFDVDDTLIVPAVVTGDVDVPNYEVIEIYKWYQRQGAHMIIWSGGGMDYAYRWAIKLGLKPNSIFAKEKADDVDIAFDDCDVNLAKVNVKVKRFDNHISRKEWNEHKNPLDK